MEEGKAKKKEERRRTGDEKVREGSVEEGTSKKGNKEGEMGWENTKAKKGRQSTEKRNKEPGTEQGTGAGGKDEVAKERMDSKEKRSGDEKGQRD